MALGSGSLRTWFALALALFGGTGAVDFDSIKRSAVDFDAVKWSNASGSE